MYKQAVSAAQDEKAKPNGRRLLSSLEAEQLLNKYDITLAKSMMLPLGEINEFTLKAAAKLAREFADETKGTFAIKLISPDAVHKSDEGFVRLGVRPKKIEDALFEICSSAKSKNYKIEGILVQEMAKEGLELFVGGKQDPQFGPVVVFGEGGLLVEYRKDLHMRICSVNGSDPVGIRMDIDEARRLINDAAIVEVMGGIRGLPKRDAEAVAGLLVNVATLLCEHPEVKELDLNPVISHKEGYSIVDARIAVGGPEGLELRRETGMDAEKKLEGLRQIMHPKSIAVIGASETNPTCKAIVERIKGSKFGKNGGQFYLVSKRSPEKETICGMEYFGSISEIPGSVDLVVIAVRPDIVPEMLRECGRNGVKGAIIITDKFKEAGFAELEEELVKASKESGVPYIGPNCVGVINQRSGVDTIFIPHESFLVPEKPGGITVVAQSGAMGVSTLRMLVGSGISFAKFISVGNASCINTVDLLRYLKDDPETAVITLYVEGLPNGKEFMQLAREASETKPVVLLKGGKSDATSKAASSHTGSAIGSWAIWEAALRQAGVASCGSLAELAAVSTAFATQPVSKGKRVGVVTNAGGFGVRIADELDASRLELPQPGDESKGNPLDLLGNSDTESFLKAVEAFLKDPNFDCVVIAPVFGTAGIDVQGLAEGILKLSKDTRKPIIVSTPLHGPVEGFARILGENGIPVCISEKATAKVVRSLWARGRFLERCNGN